MQNLNQYHDLSFIWESSNSAVFRGLSETNQSVILKLLKKEYPTIESLARYRLEYEITRKLAHLPGVIQVKTIENYQNTLVIVFEDFGGDSLKNWQKHHRFDLAEILSIGVQVAATIGEIHSHHVIHKDINPSNLVLNRSTGLLKVIDFGISSQLSQENLQFTNADSLEGTLLYISPEQTGRMNRQLDYRTDIYSLGVTLFELLTGYLPFSAEDTIELVHCHIAKEPPHPCLFNPNLPAIVGEIVLKLMAKNAEERYQSGEAIAYDLQQCLDQLNHASVITAFPLATVDIEGKFQIPQKLYGRAQQLLQLQESFDRAKSGSLELLMMSGFSGIGKSSLVQEIYKPITEQRGFFIHGKFDQFQRDVPYSALISAFQDLLKHLLSLSSAELVRWQTEIHLALGETAQVLCEVMPELTTILGPQPPVPELSSIEQLRRFQFVFLSFLRVFTRSEHPLVLFLDDLQWSDSATLQLLQHLIGSFNQGYFLIIGAYRSDEKDQSPYLNSALLEISKTKLFTTIELTNLSLFDVESLLSDTLQHPADRVQKLAKIIIKKTEGNPFFINAFLQSLYEQGLVFYDQQNHQWEWHLDQIKDCESTGNVLELMEARIQQLTVPVQQVLQIAACIGNTFNLDFLTCAAQRPLETLFPLLRKAIDGGIIVPLSSFHRYLDITEGKDITTVGQCVNYKFIHDRLQQASYALIPVAQKQKIHHQIGQELLNNYSEAEVELNLFVIVNHLNQGKDHIRSQEERDELAILNLTAGKKAKASVAFSSALQYFQTSIGLLATDSWQTNFDLSFNLHLEALESAFLTADFILMEELLAIILKFCTCVISRSRAYEVKIQAQIAEGNLVGAVRTGIFVLEQLGKKYVERPPKWQLLLGILRIRWVIFGKNIRSFIHHHPVSDPRNKAILRILTLLGSPSYFAAPKFFPLLAMDAAYLSLRYGCSSLSSAGLVACSAIFVRLEQLSIALGLADLAWAVLEKYHGGGFIAKTLVAITSFTSHWRFPVRQAVNNLTTAHNSGLETGDLEYAAQALHVLTYRSFLAGVYLSELDRDMTHHEQIIKNLNQPRVMNIIQIYHQAVADLIEEQPPRLIDANEVISQLQKNNDRHGLFNFNFCQMITCYLLNRPNKALNYAVLATEYSDAAIATLSIPALNFYTSLIWLKLYPSLSPTEKRKARKIINHNQQKMKKWSEIAPFNFLHKYLLVLGEQKRIEGNHSQAMEIYDRAINLAEEQQYLQDVALGYECAARLYLKTNRPLVANTYLHQAHYAYQRWGAHHKVKQLEKEFPTVLTAILGKDQENQTTTSASTSGDLDFATVAKAARAISQQLVLSDLLQELIRIAVENAGAQTGVLLLPERQELTLVAWHSIEPDRVFPQRAYLSQLTKDLPASVISYVARTQTSLLVPTTTTTDFYLQHHSPASLLCLPILHQNELIGVIYLENNLTTNAFSQERLTVLQVLAAQAVISLQNAQLYQELEQKVLERTSALQESEAKYRDLVQTANSIILRWDLEGNVRFLNDYGLVFFGFRETEIIGNHLIGTIVPDRLESQELLKDIIDRPDRYVVNETENLRRDGSCVWIAWSNRLINEPNQPIEILSVGHDATRRREAELNLQAAQAQIIAQEKLASLGSLTAGIAHELRNPLNFVNNFAELSIELTQEIKAELPPESEIFATVEYVAQNLQEIYNQGKRANSIIHTMLLHARHDGGTFEPTNLNELLDQAANLAYHGRKAHNTNFNPTIEKDYAPEMPMIMAVSQDLSRAFINIIDNSLYALEKVPNPDYQPRLTLKTADRVDYVEILIRDNGTGIPHTLLEKIFMPFFTNKPTGEGTGLGLSLTHDIVVGQHRGRISVDSEYGSYTQFHLTLPKHQDEKFL